MPDLVLPKPQSQSDWQHSACARQWVEILHTSCSDRP